MASAALQRWTRGMRRDESRTDFEAAIVAALGPPDLDTALVQAMLTSFDKDHGSATAILASHADPAIRALLFHRVRHARQTGRREAEHVLHALYRADPEAAFPTLALTLALAIDQVQSDVADLALETVRDGLLPVDVLGALARNHRDVSWVDALHHEATVDPALRRLIGALAWHSSGWSRGPAIGWMLTRDRPLALSALLHHDPRSGWPQGTWRPACPVGEAWLALRQRDEGGEAEFQQLVAAELQGLSVPPLDPPPWPDVLDDTGLRADWATPDQLEAWEASETTLIRPHLQWIDEVLRRHGQVPVAIEAVAPVMRRRRRRREP